MSGVCLRCIGIVVSSAPGYWTAISILSVNLIGDTINAFSLQDWRTLIGLPIAGVMIAYLIKKRMTFDR